MPKEKELSVRLEELEKKVEQEAELNAAKFLALAREEAIGTLTISGRNCPPREAKEKLFSIVAGLCARIMSVRLDVKDVKSTRRLNSSKKSPIVVRYVHLYLW